MLLKAVSVLSLGRSFAEHRESHMENGIDSAPQNQLEGVSRRQLLGNGLAAGSGALLAAYGLVDHSLDASHASEAQDRDLTFLSLQEAAVLVRTKAVSPVDLTQACLKKIETQNPILN